MLNAECAIKTKKYCIMTVIRTSRKYLYEAIILCVYACTYNNEMRKERNDIIR